MPKPRLVRRVVTWLRAGYLAGLPRKDYIALLGILHRRLTSEEIDSIAAHLTCRAKPDRPVYEHEIVAAIRYHANQQPDEYDIRRVRTHLTLGGWALASAEQGAAETDAPPIDAPEATGDAESEASANAIGPCWPRGEIFQNCWAAVVRSGRSRSSTWRNTHRSTLRKEPR